MSVSIRQLSHQEKNDRLYEIADLRIKVFKDFPYIYDGSAQYEVKYLERYIDAKDAAFIGAFVENDGEKMVGVATCLPLAQEDHFVKKPFIELGVDLEEIFYFGESVLLPEFRGQGIGHQFFDQREKYALSFKNIKKTTFCAVQRPENHPLRPTNYRPLDVFWSSRGYFKNPELSAQFSWQDHGEKAETLKDMVYWVKQWD